MSPLLLRAMPFIGGAGALTIAGLGMVLALTRGELAGALKDLAVEKAVHETDIANFRAAQALANAMRLAELDQLKSTYRSIRDEADRHSASMLDGYHSLVMRLPAAPAGTDRGDAGGGAALPHTGLSEGADRPGGDSVVLARADADICAVNTGRLEAAHAWAARLERAH